MESARTSATARAYLLERSRLAYAEEVCDRDAAVGEAEIGMASCAAAPKAAESAFVTERNFWLHVQRGLAST